jgi:hypothetical protein
MGRIRRDNKSKMKHINNIADIIKVLLIFAFSIFLLSAVSAMTVYADFTDGSQSTAITVGDSVSFNVDFFSMEPPITSMKAGLYSGNSLYYSFLNSNTNENTYYNTYVYVATLPGTYKIKVIGKDNTNTDSEFLTLVVNPAPPVNHAPVIASTPITSVNEGNPYSYNVDATDADSDTLTYSLTTAPSWLAINSATGVISGTAPSVTVDTPFSATVKVTDEHGGIDTQTYTLTVKNIPCPVNHAPVITSSPITQVDEGNPYSYNVDATDSDGDTLTYSLTSAPSWLSINSATGVISGIAPWFFYDTPFAITVHVSDATHTVAQSYTLTVKDTYVPPVNHAPVITSSPETSVVEGNIYTYDVDATDSDGDDLTYSIIDGPSWLYINPNTGEITGTAPLVSSDTDDTVEVEVSDWNGGIDTQTYTLTVEDYSHEDDDECDECSSTRIIQENLYDQNKYLNQFESKAVAYSDTSSTQKIFLLSASTLFYIILAIVCLGILLAFVIIFRNLRR